jgi:hypothetical protein
MMDRFQLFYTKNEFNPLQHITLVTFNYLIPAFQFNERRFKIFI